MLLFFIFLWSVKTKLISLHLCMCVCTLWARVSSDTENLTFAFEKHPDLCCFRTTLREIILHSSSETHYLSTWVEWINFTTRIVCQVPFLGYEFYLHDENRKSVYNKIVICLAEPILWAITRQVHYFEIIRCQSPCVLLFWRCVPTPSRLLSKGTYIFLGGSGKIMFYPKFRNHFLNLELTNSEKYSLFC